MQLGREAQVSKNSSLSPHPAKINPTQGFAEFFYEFFTPPLNFQYRFFTTPSATMGLFSSTAHGGRYGNCVITAEHHPGWLPGGSHPAAGEVLIMALFGPLLGVLILLALFGLCFLFIEKEGLL